MNEYLAAASGLLALALLLARLAGFGGNAALFAIAFLFVFGASLDVNHELRERITPDLLLWCGPPTEDTCHVLGCECPHRSHTHTDGRGPIGRTSKLERRAAR
jgi:hypothetical protein